MPEIEYNYGNYYDDVDDVIELCATWWEDSSFYKNTGMPFEVNKEYFKRLYDRGYLIIVLGRDVETKQLVACYIASKSPYHFNKNYLMANEIVWCIHKDYRDGKEVFNLLIAIEMAMKGNKINMYSLALPLTEGREKLSKYMTEKLGWFVQDSNLLKEVHYE